MSVPEPPAPQLDKHIALIRSPATFRFTVTFLGLNPASDEPFDTTVNVKACGPEPVIRSLPSLLSHERSIAMSTQSITETVIC